MRNLPLRRNEAVMFIDGANVPDGWRDRIFRVADRTGDAVAIYDQYGCWGTVRASWLVPVERGV